MEVNKDIQVNLAKDLYFMRTSTARKPEGCDWERCKNKQVWLSNADMIITKLDKGRQSPDREKIEEEVAKRLSNIARDWNISIREEEIFREIEKYKRTGSLISNHFDEYVILMTDIEYQSLKSRYGVK